MILFSPRIEIVESQAFVRSPIFSNLVDRFGDNDEI